MKRTVCCLLLICLLAATPISLAACRRAPRVDDIREDVIALVEASYEINEVFYGAGLPVLDRNSEEYAPLYTFNYAPATITNTYDIVDVAHAKFTSIDAIKSAASLVYSPDLLEKNLYVNAFTGYAIEGINSTVVASDALYTEDADYFYQSASRTNYLTRGVKIFDYDTMQVVRPSSSKAVLITMDAWYISNPTEHFSERIRLVSTPNGWRLDSATV